MNVFLSYWSNCMDYIADITHRSHGRKTYFFLEKNEDTMSFEAVIRAESDKRTTSMELSCL